MRIAAGFCLMLMLVLWSSCRSDFEAEVFTGQLEFSRDTVYLDTVFSNLSTSTFSLKVYNRSREDIFIPEINLEGGENSMYRLNVDGIPGKSFEDIEILASDSIYIFIETTVAPGSSEENEFLYIDKLQFRSQAHTQEIPLVTLVKDGIFLYPKKDAQGFPERIPVGVDENGDPQLVSGFFLGEEQLNLTGEKPYVIYGYAAVPPGETLNIEAGARLHFNTDSGIIVSENSTLHVKGSLSEDPETLENEVIFQGDRLEGLYRNIPGQWGTIWLKNGSKNHIFEHVTFRNAGIGILVEGSEASLTDLQLKNVQIYNSAVSGLLAENAEITAENLVINNSGQASLHLKGGKYNFIHTTIANYWQQSYRQLPAVYVENITEAGSAPLTAKFYNSIIFGNDNREIFFSSDESVPFEVFFSHSLIKFRFTEALGSLYDFSNSEIYENIRLNEEPIFTDPGENDLRLQKNSAAIDRGDPEVAKEVPFDLLGNSRITDPDLGAYEFSEIEE